MTVTPGDSSRVLYSSPWTLERVWMFEGDRRPLHAAIDSEVGNPAPALRLMAGRYGFRAAVKAGARTVSVDVLQPQSAALRPKLRVRANPAIGLANDVVATAGTATVWQTVSAGFSATANGGVRVEVVNEDLSWPVWFDNVKIV